MKVTRLDLDGAGSPSALVTRILEVEPNLPIPVPLEELCACLDIVAIEELMTEGFEAALITDRLKASGAILVAKDRPRQRRRFSIAHELGHFLITTHLPPSSGAFQCKAEDLRTAWSHEQARAQRMEAEANRFAAQLLMPPPLVRAEIRKARRPDIGDIVRLSDHFDVSREAMARTYVEQHREAVAVVVTRHGRLVRTYRPATRFPWIDVDVGQAVPSGSAFHARSPIIGATTTTEECEAELWFGARDVSKVETLTEQVLTQRDGFALILLHADMRDEEEDESDSRSLAWRPRF